MEKQIKIVDDNAKAIEAWLKRVNGRASRHAYCLYQNVLGIAQEAEGALDRLDLPKAFRPGAVWFDESGDKLPNAYKYAADGTRVTLVRRGPGWWLQDVEAYQIFPRHTPRCGLRLTKGQDAEAVRIFRRGYTIMPDVVAEAYASEAQS